jgi:YfiH family protein
MPFHQVGSVRYFTFPNLDDAGIRHAVFTRRGGVSPGPWAELNVGGTVGDKPNRVIENRKRAFLSMGCDTESIFDVWQVHGSNVVCTRSPRSHNDPHQKADAILTDTPGVTLFMRFADCVPILFYDSALEVIGVAHAGWKGVVKGTVSAAVEQMEKTYASKPGDIRAAIGPSIAAHHYPVGREVESSLRSAFGMDADKVLLSADGGHPEDAVHLDLWEANRLLLEKAGVVEIEMASICTACNLKDWYSHRAEHGKTGRFGVLITL